MTFNNISIDVFLTKSILFIMSYLSIEMTLDLVFGEILYVALLDVFLV